jgi:hypothetical protein
MQHITSEFFLLNEGSEIESVEITKWVIHPEGKEQSSFSIIAHSAHSSDLLRKIGKVITSDYFFLQIKHGEICISKKEREDWISEISETDALMSYCGYYESKGTDITTHPVIEYTKGSIRDDFDFGPLVLIKTKSLTEFLALEHEDFTHAGWYSFRLFISRQGQIALSDKIRYTYIEPDHRLSGEKQFDYVNPMNRNRQIEMEKAATGHLHKIGALVMPPFDELDFDKNNFLTEASVIIPVLNREKTITDAIRSVLLQKTNFPFNLIIVDNHSTDKTSALIAGFCDSRIVHHIPFRKDLGIGGCWNEAINHPACGRFAIQLDSDDLYSDENTIQRIVEKFHQEKCAMVIGSYQMVNFNLEEIPPGIIDHREWSDNNGPNNALRINGLGAPRAFYTPIIRKVGFPNVSYGEDYAVAITISREHKIGRIYEPIYLCRRWESNTDSNLSIEKANAHNRYKDSLRATEIEIRQRKKKT